MTSPPTPVAGLVVGRATFDEVFPVRRAVLRPTLPPGESRYAGDDDPAVIYMAGRIEGRIVCVATFFPEPCPWRANAADADRHWRLRGMATLPEARGRGIGAAVLDAGRAAAAAQGAALLWFKAREGAVPFYLRAGFRPEGEPLVDPDLGSQRHMWAPLP